MPGPVKRPGMLVLSMIKDFWLIFGPIASKSAKLSNASNNPAFEAFSVRYLSEIFRLLTVFLAYSGI